ncbi:MAG: hypothetical protein R3F43_14795 [bacterium]
MAEALRVGQRLRQAVAEGVTPGAAFGLVAGGQVVRTWFVGHHAPEARWWARRRAGTWPRSQAPDDGGLVQPARRGRPPGSGGAPR